MSLSFPRAFGGNPVFISVDARLKRSGMAITWVNYLIRTPNADEPQPKRLTGANKANREGNDWEILFSFLISVYSVFSVLNLFVNQQRAFRSLF